MISQQNEGEGDLHPRDKQKSLTADVELNVLSRRLLYFARTGYTLNITVKYFSFFSIKKLVVYFF